MEEHILKPNKRISRRLLWFFLGYLEHSISVFEYLSKWSRPEYYSTLMIFFSYSSKLALMRDILSQHTLA